MPGVVLPTWTERFLADQGAHMKKVDAEITLAELEGGEALAPYLKYGTTATERQENFCVAKYDDYRSLAMAEHTGIPGLKVMGNDTVVFPKDTPQEEIARYKEVTEMQFYDDLRAACFRVVLKFATDADTDFVAARSEGPDVLDAVHKRVALIGSNHCAFEECKKQGVIFCTKCDTAGYCTMEHLSNGDKHKGMECDFAAYVVENGHVKQWVGVLRGDDGADTSYHTKEKRLAEFRTRKCATECSKAGCTMVCAKCREAHYCNAVHQTADWRSRHRTECRRIVAAKKLVVDKK